MLERNPEVEQLSNLCDAVVPRVLLENNTSWVKISFCCCIEIWRSECTISEGLHKWSTFMVKLKPNLILWNI